MSLKFLHLFPIQLGLNGETGNLNALVQRLDWAGIEAEVEVFDGTTSLPERIDAVFIGSGTLAGALVALEGLRPQAARLRELAKTGTPFLAVGLGWEILGQSMSLEDGVVLEGIGVFPSSSVRTGTRASAECFGFDGEGNLTTGYANHSSEIELAENAKPLLLLSAGFGNSSSLDAKTRPEEGLIFENLMAARLNGPLLALNPHLADSFLGLVAARSGLSYRKNSRSQKADGFAAKARQELQQRLAR